MAISTLPECRGRIDDGEASKAEHPNGIKLPVPPDAARGYIGVGISAPWTIPGSDDLNPAEP